MPRRRFESVVRGKWNRWAATAVVAAAVAMGSVGCSTCTVNCPEPATHAMAFGVTNAGCPDGAWECVCPVPKNLDLTRGDHILFVNTSPYEITIKATTAGTFYPTDKFTVPAGDEVLVTVEDNPPDDDVDLDVTVDGGQGCPGTASPGIIIRKPLQSSS